MRYADPVADWSDEQANAEPPMETGDDGDDLALYPRECPVELLGVFCLLMAAQGRTVSSTRMLVDRNHAMWQLARARTSDDDSLRRLAARLFVWFERG
jgi:hypothetical protein